MYDSKVEISTINAIKQNLDGIKKISKERILIELYKILDLKNFINLNESTHLKEIFSLIFPEFENLKRLERLVKICNYTQVNKELLLAVLLIDEKNNHEYFAHKYNVSNNIKENLHMFAKNLTLIRVNKDFFKKELEKYIYLNDKNHLINLNILNFVINEKIKFKDFSDTLKKILQSKKQKFPIDGKYLMDNGMKQGSQMGKVLKKIEEEWIKNNFKISEDQMKEIIRLHSN